MFNIKAYFIFEKNRFLHEKEVFPAALARLRDLLGRQTEIRRAANESFGGIGAGRRPVSIRNMANNKRRRAGIAGASGTQRALRSYINARRRTAQAVGVPTVAELNRMEGLGGLGGVVGGGNAAAGYRNIVEQNRARRLQ